MVILGGYQVAATIGFYYQSRGVEHQPVSGLTIGSPWPTITAADERAAGAGLTIGDKMIEVQGQPFHGISTLNQAMETLFPGDRLRVKVQAGTGVEREVSWQVAGREAVFTPLPRVLFVFLMFVVMPFFCLVVGFWTVLARPGQLQAWLLLALLASFAHSVVHPGPFPSSLGALGSFFHLLHTGLNSSWGLTMLLFAWEFPRRTPWQRQQVWPLAAILLAAMLAMVEREALMNWGDPAAWGAWIDRLSEWRGYVRLLQMIGIGCFFALLFYKKFKLDDVDSRRRLKTLLAGAQLALTPMLFVVLAMLAGVREEDVPHFILIPAILAMFLFPLTLGYLIVVQRAFGLGLVVRQGLQYALATRGLRVVQALLIIGIILTVVVLALRPGMNRPRILQIAAIGTFLVLGLQAMAERLGKWVDRRFFREDYNAEQVLASLSDDVRTMVETKPLLEAVATRIGEALHVDRVLLLLREDGGFRPAYALGLPAGGGALPLNSRTAEILRRDREPLKVYREDTNSWIYQEGLSSEETSWLWATGAELILPLAVKDKLLGFISMGSKKSEEPYSGNDLRLLQSVALQAGLALENSQLAAAVTEAVAQRERLNREVEIAKEVQEMLLPQKLPEIPNMDYFGYCRPARGVGGDSYDFLALDSEVLAICISDVSGKGIPASLLMASLQSALRGQAMSRPPDLGVMITHLNRMIYESSPASRYATLFYSQFDLSTKVLTYVNGGHCPPMVLRGDQILRLEEGGPVVGLFGPARFTQGIFQVEAGDVLVGFTDGISEAMNSADDEWGEEALGVFLQQHRGDTARELIPKIVAAADAFANGAPQHDDMTLIVVRFL